MIPRVRVPTIDLTSPSTAAELQIEEEVRSLRNAKQRAATLSPKGLSKALAFNSTPAPPTPCPRNTVAGNSGDKNTSFGDSSKRPRVTGSSSTGSSWSIVLPTANPTVNRLGTTQSAGESSTAVTPSSAGVGTPSSGSAGTSSSDTSAKKRRELRDTVNSIRQNTIILDDPIYFYLRDHQFTLVSHQIVAILLKRASCLQEFTAAGTAAGLSEGECKFIWWLSDLSKPDEI